MLVRHFIGIIDGPPKTPYEGGKFRVDLFCSPNYPNEPPVIILFVDFI
jgi:ubiquitin-protein ligase